jgi:hypothetical protein
VGLTYLPDPANQVPALAARNPESPRGEEPRPGDGLWQPTDLISLQEDIAASFDGSAG